GFAAGSELAAADRERLAAEDRSWPAAAAVVADTAPAAADREPAAADKEPLAYSDPDADRARPADRAQPAAADMTRPGPDRARVAAALVRSADRERAAADN